MESNALLNATLSLDSDISLYAQLVGIIKRNISTGVLAVGDLLPSEAELCRTLSISRNTVRQAIGELEEEGLVVRKRGRGTFVADPATNRRGVRYSFTTEVSSMGKEPSSTLVDFQITTPSAIICDKMELREGTPVYCFTRVRNVDGEPLILETSYYPQYIYPNLTRDMLQTHSFYSLLYHVGITPFAAEESYEAVTLSSDNAKLLGRPQGHTLHIRGLTASCGAGFAPTLPPDVVSASVWTYICRNPASTLPAASTEKPPCGAINRKGSTTMGKFVVKATKTGFVFNLKAGNGEVIATSEIYTTEATCMKGVESVRKNAADAKLEDQTVAEVAAVTNPKFELYTDKAGEFRFRLKARNGEIIAVSEGYKAKASCLNGIDSVRRNAPDAAVEKPED